MKNKIKILVSLCILSILFANNLFAWKITLSGKGKYGYNYVHVDDAHHTIICSNPGTITCPVSYSRAIGQTGKEYLMEEIVNDVLKQVQSGKMSGDANYLDGITYSWTAKNVTDMEINIVDFTK